MGNKSVTKFVESDSQQLDTDNAKKYDPAQVDELFRSGNFSKAKSICKQYLTTEPHACYSLGNYWATSDYYGEKAQKYFNMGIQLKDANCCKGSADLYFKGINNSLTNDLAEVQRQTAIDLYTKYIELSSEKDVKYYKIIGNLHYDSLCMCWGKNNRKYELENKLVIEWLEKYISSITTKEISKEDVSTIYHLAYCYQSVNMDKTLEYYKMIFYSGIPSHIHSIEYNILKYICEILLNDRYDKNDKEIFEWFKKCVEKELKDSKFLMASALFKIKQYAKAKEFCLLAERETCDHTLIKKCQNLLSKILLECDNLDLK
ncbi:MAG: hypothetical protein Edafosvirus17_1 [Edafosvirus sp.]|uniref:Tetratricopeptide repeat protein n=1 Tax=Edafosvirus sp. TaxID=2487765 RepID=A0A3G4ZUF7_9VIRU|nr:MAG: hypothetical protein Edafosvirus17_1 [Edafosvirus sp.]